MSPSEQKWKVDADAKSPCRWLGELLGKPGAELHCRVEQNHGAQSPGKAQN